MPRARLRASAWRSFQARGGLLTVGDQGAPSQAAQTVMHDRQKKILVKCHELSTA